MAGLIAMCAVFVVVSIEMAFSTMNGEALGGCHGGHSHTLGGNSDRPEYQPIVSGAGEEEIDGGIGGGAGRDGHRRVNGNAAEATTRSEEGELDALDEIATKRRVARHRRSSSIAGGLRNFERSVCCGHSPWKLYSHISTGRTSPWVS